MKIPINPDGTIDSDSIKKIIREILEEMGLAPNSKFSSSEEKKESLVENEVIKPAVAASVASNQIENFDELFSSGEEIIRLPESWYGKEISIRSNGMIKPGKVKAIIGNETRLTFAEWNSSPTQLFDLENCQELGIRGCTFLCPPNRPMRTGFPDKELFGWKRDSVFKGKFAYIDGQEIKDKERVTYGLSRFCYSSDSPDRIYLIAENIHHNGFNFTQIKNPEKGNLWLILRNVSIYNPVIEQPRSHYYSPTRFKVRVSVKDGIATIISDNTFDQILTHWGYNIGSQRSILHFDRFVFDISEVQLIDQKTLKLWDQRGNLERISPQSIRTNFELQPLDQTNLGIVVSKQIDETRRFNWVYEMDRPSFETEIKLSYRQSTDGEFDAFIVSKGNALFSVPVTKETKFGDDYWESGVITISHGYGWTWYNEEFSGFIENYHGLGYHRNSGGSGITQGLTIKDSTFEFNPPLPTGNLEKVPDEVSDYLKWLRSI
ncbi:hypothetical protein DFQ04_0248 [Algoriphagus boseongensis]|uniref:Uncharacterized protein n=1 Tax=Algoriphagus boseongensis TaxID=1442587 RepID=A0A4R6T8B5_9BACT|nr:hypothetical protein [Algoriphagus boseongensis]TDQ18449.1 hypothetical protein DFQ04_0248 [Algoriphagus boseongensis]